MATNAGWQAYDKEEETREIYLDRFNIYCMVNDIEDETKKATTFLNAVGAKTLKLLKKLAAPKKPADLTFTEIVTILEKCLDYAPRVLDEDYKFHK